MWRDELRHVGVDLSQFDRLIRYFDPARHGVPIMEAQRRMVDAVSDVCDRQISLVGGTWSRPRSTATGSPYVWCTAGTTCRGRRSSRPVREAVQAARRSPLSAFVLHLRDAEAFLWSDGARWSGDSHVLIDIVRKTTIVPGQKIVLSATGDARVGTIAADFFARGGIDADELMSDARYLLLYLRKAVKASCDERFDIGIAGFAAASQKPFALYLGSGSSQSVVDIRTVDDFFAVPGLKEEQLPHFWGALGVDDLAKATPDRLGRVVLNSLRRNDYAVPGWSEDGSLVGGHVLQTRVAADGITERIIHTWPDVIGEKIDCRRESPAPVHAGRLGRRSAGYAEIAKGW